MTRITERELQALHAGMEPPRAVVCSACDAEFAVTVPARTLKCDACYSVMRIPREQDREHVFTCTECLRETIVPVPAPVRRLVAEVRRLRELVARAQMYVDTTRAPVGLQEELSAEVAALQAEPS
jgi:primosomal protein N'